MKPELVLKLNQCKISQISCGFSHTLLLTSNGVIFGWGDNRMGQLGLNDHYIYEPQHLRLNEENKIAYIFCSLEHSFVSLNNGFVYMFGENESKIKVKTPKIINILNIKINMLVL